MSVRIRPARIEEAELLTRISLQAKNSWGYPNTWLEAWSEEITITHEMINEWITFVVEVDGQVVAGWSRSPCESETTSPGVLFVSPEQMGKGYGRLLGEAVIKEAKLRGLKRLTIEADPNAVSFYEKIGGKVIGEQASLLIPNRILPIIRFEFNNTRKEA